MFSIQVEITVFSIHLMTIPAVLLQSGNYENLKYYYDQNIQDIYSYYCYNRYFVLTIYFNLSKRFMKGNANQQSNEQENGPDNSQRVPANIQMVSNVEQPIQYPLQRILIFI